MGQSLQAEIHSAGYIIYDMKSPASVPLSVFGAFDHLNLGGVLFPHLMTALPPNQRSGICWAGDARVSLTPRQKGPHPGKQTAHAEIWEPQAVPRRVAVSQITPQFSYLNHPLPIAILLPAERRLAIEPDSLVFVKTFECVEDPWPW
ncbi:MAG: hypothetical protein ACYCZA_07415 [Thiobacillus sp.]